jgi:RNA polymerase sigma-70 factor (sigma-E family)
MYREMTMAGVDRTGADERRVGADMAALFEATYPRVRRIALAMTADPHQADDLAQDSFVRAWKTLARGDGNPDAAMAYLRVTVINLVRRSFKRRLLDRRVMGSESERQVLGPESRVDLLMAIRTLPPRQRACVVLRYLEDLSEADTAQTLEISVGTVKSQTHKALARLNAILGGEYGTD